MSVPDSYKTIENPSEGIYKEKGSRFYAFAYSVEQEEEVKNILFNLRKKYHDARHHCYAYKLGTGDDRYRTNDDGEPSGTAGKPILGQIHSAGLTNILIVVIRYFGGTLLGTSGLIRAYRAAAADAIQNGIIMEKKIRKWYKIYFGYPQMNDVMKLLKEGNLKPMNQNFGEKCELAVAVPLSEIPLFLNRIKVLNNVIPEEIESLD
jgi:uncharacterized YigZ family protein